MATQLRRLLIEKSERQYELAQRAGFTETRLSRIACGRAEPTKDECARLANALGVTEAEIFAPSQRPEGSPQATGGSHVRKPRGNGGSR
jgi:transcriptional regulator with XRE-family HTH domain